MRLKDNVDIFHVELDICPGADRSHSFPISAEMRSLYIRPCDLLRVASSKPFNDLASKVIGHHPKTGTLARCGRGPASSFRLLRTLLPSSI